MGDWLSMAGGGGGASESGIAAIAQAAQSSGGSGQQAQQQPMTWDQLWAQRQQTPGYPPVDYARARGVGGGGYR